MAQDRPDRPMTDAEIETLREEMREQRGEIREYLEGEDVDVSTWDNVAGDDPALEGDRDAADSD